MKGFMLCQNRTSAKCLSSRKSSSHHFCTFLRMVAENSKMAILFFPLILVLNDPFLRAGSPWSLSLDAAISTAATGSPVPEHNLSLSSISWAIWLRIHVFMDARWWKQTDTGLEKDPNLLIFTSGSTSDLQTQTHNKPSVYICLFQFPHA